MPPPINDADLISAQYADRPHLRPVLDAILRTLPDIGEVGVQARRTQVSLVGPRRTFAIVQATTRARVDVSLRLAPCPPDGRLKPVRGEEFAARLELGAAEDLDGEAIGWLRRAYDESTVARPRAPRPAPPLARELVHVTVEAFAMPGRRCNPDPTGYGYDNVHVGLCSTAPQGWTLTVVPHRPWQAVGVVAGDAASARWDFDVTLRRFEGELDITGPAVRGRRGARHIGLAWGEVPGDGTFRLFRALGLRLAHVDAGLLDAAGREGTRLVARLGLTDAKGNPRCAGVPARDVEWSLE